MDSGMTRVVDIGWWSGTRVVGNRDEGSCDYDEGSCNMTRVVVVMMSVIGCFT
jgi:hypothetical protein